MMTLGTYKGYEVRKAFDQSKQLTAYSFTKDGQTSTIHTNENIVTVVWAFNHLR